MSTGNVQLNHTDDGSRNEQVVSANLHIANCTNLNVTVRMTGNNASVASQLLVDAMLAEVYGDKLFEDKSFALIYAHNETRSMDRILRIGQRQPNDTLLVTETVRVNNELNSFPQHEIAYDNSMDFITQTEFTFNVSHPIIYYCCFRIVIALACQVEMNKCSALNEHIYQIELVFICGLLLIDCIFFHFISFQIEKNSIKIVANCSCIPE